MGILGRLFGGQPADKNTQSSTVLTTKRILPTEMNSAWRRFFSVVRMHWSAQSAMMAFVGEYPGPAANRFFLLDMPTLTRRIREYQTMPYPLRSPLFPMDHDTRPDYQMVDGRIARVSTVLDMIFIGVIPPDVKKKFKLKDQVEPAQVAWKLIEHYSEMPLARFIFILPFMYSASEAAKKDDKAVVVIIEDMLIQVYKGVENVLFDVYSDLPEGAVLSEMEVWKKLNSLLAHETPTYGSQPE